MKFKKCSGCMALDSKKLKSRKRKTKSSKDYGLEASFEDLSFELDASKNSNIIDDFEAVFNSEVLQCSLNDRLVKKSNKIENISVTNLNDGSLWRFLIL